MTTWFTSDQHYGHKNIIGYSGRQFSDEIEMETALIQNHNLVVRPDDIVYHLGDFALDHRLVRHILPRLNGTHFLLPGNHDRCHPRKTDAAKWARKYESWGFRKVITNPFPVFQDEPYRIVLSHCPSADYEDPRYPEWRPAADSYDILLHGHVHERWRVKTNPCLSTMINVGVDQWNMTPVSWQEIQDLIQSLAIDRSRIVGQTGQILVPGR